MENVAENPVSFFKITVLSVGILNILLTAQYHNENEAIEVVYLYIQVTVFLATLLWTLLYMTHTVKKHSKACTAWDTFHNVVYSCTILGGTIGFIISQNNQADYIDYSVQRIVICFNGVNCSLLYFILSMHLLRATRSNLT